MNYNWTSHLHSPFFSLLLEWDFVGLCLVWFWTWVPVFCADCTAITTSRANSWMMLQTLNHVLMWATYTLCFSYVIKNVFVLKHWPWLFYMIMNGLCFVLFCFIWDKEMRKLGYPLIFHWIVSYWWERSMSIV